MKIQLIKPTKFLEELLYNEIHISLMARKINTTYAYAIRLSKYLEEIGLVKHYFDKNKKKLKLTEKGREVTNLLIKLNNLLE